MRKENSFERLMERMDQLVEDGESRYNLILQKDACEVQLCSKNKKKDFSWKFYTKQKKESWFEKAPKATKELFRGTVLETQLVQIDRIFSNSFRFSFQKKNQLAYQCKAGQNFKEALKLLLDMQRVSPGPIHTVIMETEILPYWGAFNFAEKLVSAIGECENLCVYGRLDKQILTVLLDRIKVSKYLMVNDIQKVHLDHEKVWLHSLNSKSELVFQFSKLPYFNVQTSEDVPLSQLLACAGNDGSFILPNFNIAKTNNLLKYWLSSRIDTMKTLTVVVNEQTTRNFHKIIDGLEQYGAKEGKELEWVRNQPPYALYYLLRRPKSKAEKIEIIRCLGFEVHRLDGAIGTVLLSRDRRARIPFYNFVLHVRYPDDPWPKCKFAAARDYFQERNKDMALAVEWNKIETLKILSDMSTLTSTLEQQKYRLYTDDQKVLNSQRARSQLRIQHFKHAWQIHSHAERRQEYGFFGLPL